ncbi:MAG: aldo/keto reductase [Verrucomicrobia bacterium]|nr:aldo/keto reductase [Verrucomicrobiota bacterium]
MPDHPTGPTRLAAFSPSAKLAALGLGDSRMALGLAGLGGAWGPVDEGESLETLLHAMAEGVTVFDVAPAYAQAEPLLGRALARWRGPRPIVSTKVGRLAGPNALRGSYDYSPRAIRDSLRASLDRMGLAAVDLVFLHEPDQVPPADRPRVAATLCELQTEGLARRIGLGGGCGADWSEYVATGVVDVAMGFNRLNALNSAALTEDLPALRPSAAYYAASPLAMGILSARPDRWRAALPPWLTPRVWPQREQLFGLATEQGIPLTALALRYLFGVAEADRVVLGAANAAELADALAAWRAGPLPPEVFAAVVATQM